MRVCPLQPSGAHLGRAASRDDGRVGDQRVYELDIAVTAGVRETATPPSPLSGEGRHSSAGSAGAGHDDRPQQSDVTQRRITFGL